MSNDSPKPDAAMRTAITSTVTQPTDGTLTGIADIQKAVEQALTVLELELLTSYKIGFMFFTIDGSLPHLPLGE